MTYIQGTKTPLLRYNLMRFKRDSNCKLQDRLYSSLIFNILWFSCHEHRVNPWSFFTCKSTYLYVILTILLHFKNATLCNTCDKSTATCNFIKKETLAQVFSCEFCEIFKKTFFHRTPQVAASAEYTLSSKCFPKNPFPFLILLIPY